MSSPVNSPLSLRKLTRRERVEKYGPTPTREEFDSQSETTDLSFLSDWKPPSENLAPIEANEIAALDAMLERNGLARVLKTLRELCESRAPSEFDCGSTFTDVVGGEQWHDYARHIEGVIGRLK